MRSPDMQTALDYRLRFMDRCFELSKEYSLHHLSSNDLERKTPTALLGPQNKARPTGSSAQSAYDQDAQGPEQLGFHRYCLRIVFAALTHGDDGEAWTRGGNLRVPRGCFPWTAFKNPGCP